MKSQALPRRPWIEDGRIVGMILDTQRYRFLRLGVYVGPQSGNVFDGAWYASECATCGTPFEAFSDHANKSFSAARRCDGCKRSGYRVRDELKFQKEIR